MTPNQPAPRPLPQSASAQAGDAMTPNQPAPRPLPQSASAQAGDAMQHETGNPSSFPVAAGVLLGLGLGGFFDGIVLHQLLQWHHLVTSAGYPPDSVDNLRLNTFWDGVFHAGTYLFTVAGLLLLWRPSRERHLRWPGRLLPGSLLVGFGLFNLVEGLIDHQLLGLHHVNETVPREQWIYWDIAFLAWGAAMLGGGWLLLRSGLRAPSRHADDG